MKRQPAVYILTNQSHSTLYTGVTSNLIQRIWQHKHGTYKGFTEKYHIHSLVYYEYHDDMLEAITREKQIKRWKRQWKINLINKVNATWEDLFSSLVRSDN